MKKWEWKRNPRFIMVCWAVPGSHSNCFVGLFSIVSDGLLGLLIRLFRWAFYLFIYLLFQSADKLDTIWALAQFVSKLSDPLPIGLDDKESVKFVWKISPKR